VLLNNPPDMVVNCAAYTAVDKAEEDIEKANLTNGKLIYPFTIL